MSLVGNLIIFRYYLTSHKYSKYYLPFPRLKAAKFEAPQERQTQISLRGRAPNFPIIGAKLAP